MQPTTLSKTKIHVVSKRYLADTFTPVTLYLKLRDHFTDPILLESNDSRSRENSFSFIGLDAIATFQVQNKEIRQSGIDGQVQKSTVVSVQDVPEALRQFATSFELDHPGLFPGFNGFFGHTSFDAVQYFDTLDFPKEKRKFDIPDIHYSLYRFVIAFNHFKEEIYVIENIPEGMQSRLTEVERLMNSQKLAIHEFELKGQERSNLTDEEFMELVRIGKQHCQLGDVFQIVFSRQFQQDFQGDDFNVYRVLRSINPSPYLFYFDCGSYRIFGSSPEAQMVIKNGQARVNPIAGTYRRTGNDAEDTEKAKELAKDPKENAEHIMLVDLARNDLGRHAKNVTVRELKDIQFFSHVIHLVSTVTGDLTGNTNPFQVFGDTFPAGTLSGAPKYKAIELINKYENQNRAFYGGAIGFIDFDGQMNQAIVIRSFMSKDNTLHYQAGAGIVTGSVEEKELQEVNNKLGALTKALKEAQKI